MANLSSFFPAAGGGVGGAVPKTEIFTSSGVWNVPQSVQDEIESEGHSEIGLLMVGGGASTTNSGEIVNEVYKLTTADYDPAANWSNPNQPEVTIVVGAVNGDTGITLDPSVNTTTQALTSNNAVSYSVATISNLPLTFGEPNRDSNNYPLVTEVFISTSITTSGDYFIQQRSNYSFSGFTTDPTVTPAVISPAPTSSSPATGANIQNGFTLTWATPQPFDGTFTLPIYIATDPSRLLPGSSITYDATNDYFLTSQGPWNGSGVQARLNLNVTYELVENLSVKKARSGSSTQLSQFLNLSTSTEGYFGGFGRVGSTKPNSGAPGQGGYVQIFYS